MRHIVASAALAATLSLVAPTLAQAQGIPQVLQGLMTGNQDQDRAVREAYERGYQKGRLDEAQIARRGNRRNDDEGSYGRNPQAPYDPRSGGYSR